MNKMITVSAIFVCGLVFSACVSTENFDVTPPPPPPQFPSIAGYELTILDESDPELELCSELFALLEVADLSDGWLQSGKVICDDQIQCNEELVRNEFKLVVLKSYRRIGQIWAQIGDAADICNKDITRPE